MVAKEEQFTFEGEYIELRGNKGYDIYLDDEQIGTIEGDYCFLESIHIEPDKRNQGFGTEAVGLFIEIAKSSGCDTITTSSVLHSGMEHILENKHDFELTDGENMRFKKEL